MAAALLSLQSSSFGEKIWKSKKIIFGLGAFMWTHRTVFIQKILKPNPSTPEKENTIRNVRNAQPLYTNFNGQTSCHANQIIFFMHFL